VINLLNVSTAYLFTFLCYFGEVIVDAVAGAMAANWLFLLRLSNDALPEVSRRGPESLRFRASPFV
jgi:hypothetical protein